MEFPLSFSGIGPCYALRPFLRPGTLSDVIFLSTPKVIQMTLVLTSWYSQANKYHEPDIYHSQRKKKEEI